MTTHRTRWTRWTGRLAAAACVAVLAAAVSFGSDSEEDGTGLSLGRGLDLMNTVLGTDWTSALEQHPDFVEYFGISECMGCHTPEAQGYDNDFASGCLTCHGPEFCGTPGSEGLSVCSDYMYGDKSEPDDDEFVPPILSAGNMLMNTVLGVDWPNPLEQHRDYVEEQGVANCTGCHGLEMGGKVGPSTFAAPGCLSCHGPEFCGAPGTEDAAICMDHDDDEIDEEEDDDDDHRSSWWRSERDTRSKADREHSSSFLTPIRRR